MHWVSTTCEPREVAVALPVTACELEPLSLTSAGDELFIPSHTKRWLVSLFSR